MYDKVTAAVSEIEAIAADSACKTPHICKKMCDDSRILITTYQRSMSMKGGHECRKYVQDSYYDCVLRLEYQS